MIHTGDCIEVMRGMPADSVDAVVTDPPAGVSFMSKNWDHDKGGRTEWVAWMTEVMRECYRVLKPGGYAVVWSLPRTCHWTAWAMEDAGFIIRDQLAHIFASGFPKGKAQLKPAREDWWLARKPGPLRPLGIDECRIGTAKDWPASPSESRATYGTFNGREEKQEWIEPAAGVSPEVSAEDATEESTIPVLDAPATAISSRPSSGDASAGRWPSNVLLSDPALFDEPNPEVVGSGATLKDGVAVNRNRTGNEENGGYGGWAGAVPAGTPDAGFGGSGGYSRFFLIPKSSRSDREPVVRGQLERRSVARLNAMGDDPPEDIDPVSRRFTTQARGNTHPTVKPVDLMRHLIRLVTPSGGTVLDCFAGSGSTLIAAELEGFPWIGIEQDPEYVAIAEARLNGTQRGLGLDVGAPTRTRTTKPLEARSLKEQARLGKSNADRASDVLYFGRIRGQPDKEPAA